MKRWLEPRGDEDLREVLLACAVEIRLTNADLRQGLLNRSLRQLIADRLGTIARRQCISLPSA